MLESPVHWWHAADSFGFILFVVIEALFVALFLLLFLTLIRRLVYLAKKHDKHNASILRRISLLYRTGLLFVSNVLCHTFYLVYVNTDGLASSSGGYLFSGNSIALGFCILFSFVVKAELKQDSTESISSKSSTKNSLDENFCSGSINSPLSFYTNQELDKDNECPPGTTGKTTKIPLTILSSQQHQQQQQQHQQHQQQQQTPHITTIEPCLHVDGLDAHSMDTFLGGGRVGSVAASGGAPTICQQVVTHEQAAAALALAASSHGALCNYTTISGPYGPGTCYDLAGNLLTTAGGGSGVPPTAALITIETSPGILIATAAATGPPQPGLVPVSSASGAGGGGSAASVSIEWHQQSTVPPQHSHACGHRPEPLPATVSFLPAIATSDTGDFVGVAALDILKGVGQDSIVGIRSKALEVNDTKKVVTVIESSSAPASSCLVGPSSSNVSPQSTNRPGGKAITATTATSPGLPVLPYYSEQQQQQQQHSTLPVPTAATAGSSTMPPIITVTSDDPVRTHGDGSMLDRISHDLDYLLNRTAEADGATGIPSSTVVPIQLRPTSAGPSGTLPTVVTPGPGHSAHPSQGSISAPLVPTCHGVHEVIIEESEEVDS
ncbi:uncharacterized protein LOC125959543 [Anopheles darlingi]|uniref:uncharacterized protein LOC125959543 n=1 Tax=Anopheles darlingi TaxID=43151 RepID=UPI002100590C|nr:uncharacterized protein LOC125959543 [Anopheles darlingi]